MAELRIYRVTDDKPIRFAATELKKYLARATGAARAIRVRSGRTCGPDAVGIRLGTFESLGLGRDGPDDMIDIKVRSGRGHIAGANPRSVLLAAYRYLTELGFRWIRPGRDGELVPTLKLPLTKSVAVAQQGSYGHREICIEGASSWRHVRDMIEWMPKLGFNGYFVQFTQAFNFFDRWYRHEMNPRLKKERFTTTDAQRFTRRIWDECQKRGMHIHMVGHGWTCDPFGVPGEGWYQLKGPIPRTIKPYLAKVNGKREFWGGVPLNTNLCYGNRRPRKIMAKAVADYAEVHPHVDVVHLWLADGCNNHCECPRCADHRPADLYLKLLNEVDKQMTRRQLDAKVVFLVYVDLLWSPKVEKLNNPDRFILMFAPITRTYTDSFAAARTTGVKLRPFKRNKLVMPGNIDENLAHLRTWQKKFKGDSFDFDYHVMWDHFKDPGYYNAAKVLHQDIKALRDIGINGLNSCQVQRAFLPTGLMMTVMGRTLWNRDLPFDSIANDYYKSAFGGDWQKVKRYTQRLSDLFDPPHLRGERDEAGMKQTVRKLARIPDMVRKFEPVIHANLAVAEPCHAKSWYYLKEHARLCLAMAPAMELTIRGDEQAARQAVDKMVDLAQRQERKLHPVFDMYFFLVTIAREMGWTHDQMP